MEGPLRGCTSVAESLLREAPSVPSPLASWDSWNSGTPAAFARFSPQFPCVHIQGLGTQVSPKTTEIKP